MIDGQPGVIIEQTLPPELSEHMLGLQVMAEGHSTLMSKERLEHQLEHLLHQPIRSVHDLEKWLYKESLLSEKLEEMGAWVYINFKRHHDDEEAKRHYDEWNSTLLPLIEKYSHLLDQKI